LPSLGKPHKLDGIQGIFLRPLILILVSLTLCAQTPAPPAASPAPPQAPRARPAAYPEHPAASPEVLARGKALYGVNCNFCHGSDARGGEGGPNLLRSEMVLNDKNGENITNIIHNGRLDQGMPKFPFTDQQISDVAAYLHSFKVGGYDVSRMKPLTILVGDAKAGQATFQSKCASCHSGTGDLQGIGARIPDAKLMQNTWLMPGGNRGPRPAAGSILTHVPPVTVTVTTPTGTKTEGRIGRIDDFIVTVLLADGSQQTFRRDGDTPKVEIHDPLAPHKALLPTYTDNDIHNLTAYLVTLK